MQRGVGRGASLASLIRQAEDHYALCRPVDSFDKSSRVGKARHAHSGSAERASSGRLASPSRRWDDAASDGLRSIEDLHASRRLLEGWLAGSLEETEANGCRTTVVLSKDAIQQMEIQAKALLRVSRSVQQLETHIGQMESAGDSSNAGNADVAGLGTRLTALEVAVDDELKRGPPQTNVSSADLQKLSNRIIALETSVGAELKMDDLDKRYGEQIQALENHCQHRMEEMGQKLTESLQNLLDGQLQEYDRSADDHCQRRMEEVRQRMTENICLLDNLDKHLKDYDRRDDFDQRLASIEGVIINHTKLEAEVEKLCRKTGALEVLFEAAPKEQGSSAQHHEQQEIFERRISEQVENVGQALEKSVEDVLQQRLGDYHKQQETFEKKMTEQVENVGQALEDLIQQRLGELNHRLEQELPGFREEQRKQEATGASREGSVGLETQLGKKIEVLEAKMAQAEAILEAEMAQTEAKMNQNNIKFLEATTSLKHLEQKVETLQVERNLEGLQLDIFRMIDEQMEKKWTEQQADIQDLQHSIEKLNTLPGEHEAGIRDLKHSMGQLSASVATCHDTALLRKQLNDQKSEYTESLGAVEERLEMLEVQGVDRETLVKAMEERLDRLAQDCEVNLETRKRVAKLEQEVEAEEACVEELQADVAWAEVEAEEAFLAKTSSDNDDRRSPGPPRAMAYTSGHTSESSDVGPPTAKETRDSNSGVPSFVSPARGDEEARGIGSSRDYDPHKSVASTFGQQEAKPPNSANVPQPVALAFTKQTTEPSHTGKRNSRVAAAFGKQWTEPPSSKADEPGTRSEPAGQTMASLSTNYSFDTDRRHTMPPEPPSMELWDELLDDLNDSSDKGVEWEPVKAPLSEEKVERPETSSPAGAMPISNATKKIEVSSPAAKLGSSSAAEKSEGSSSAAKLGSFSFPEGQSNIPRGIDEISTSETTTPNASHSAQQKRDSETKAVPIIIVSEAKQAEKRKSNLKTKSSPRPKLSPRASTEHRQSSESRASKVCFKDGRHSTDSQGSSLKEEFGIELESSSDDDIVVHEGEGDEEEWEYTYAEEGEEEEVGDDSDEGV